MIERQLQLPPFSSFFAPHGESIGFADLVFPITHSTIVPLGEGARLEGDFRLRFPVADFDKAALVTWKVDGEPSEVIRILLYSERLDPLGILFPQTDGDFLFSRPRKSAFEKRGPGTVAEDIATTIRQAPQRSLNIYRRFFADLNFNTRPFFIGTTVPGYEPPYNDTPDKLKTIISTATDVLKDRVIERAKTYHETGRCRPFAPLSGTTTLTKDDAVTLSSLQLAIWRRHFGDDVRRMGRAFEHFANGDLGFSLSDASRTAQPNSAFYFLFGEFALLAMSECIHDDFWASVAPSLIATQPIYCSAYLPDSSGTMTKFDSYRPANHSRLKACGQEELRGCRFRPCNLPLERLAQKAAENAIRAFPGNLP